MTLWIFSDNNQSFSDKLQSFRIKFGKTTEHTATVLFALWRPPCFLPRGTSVLFALTVRYLVVLCFLHRGTVPRARHLMLFASRYLRGFACVHTFPSLHKNRRLFVHDRRERIFFLYLFFVHRNLRPS